MRPLLCSLLLLCAPSLAAQAAFLNPSFDGDGIASPAVGTTSSTLDVLIESDESIVLAGETDNVAGVFKLQANGALDLGFGSSGLVAFDFGNRLSFTSYIDRLDDGDLLAAGSVSNSDQSDIGFGFVARLSPTGALRSTFGTNGIARIGERSGLFSRPAVVDAEVLDDGRILVAASARDPKLDQIIVLVRLQADGSFDTTFGTEGVAVIDALVVINDIELLDDGRVILSGFLPTSTDGSTADAALVGVTPGGTLDTSFGTSGGARLSLGGDFDRFRGIDTDSEGRIVVAGTSEGATTEAVVARYSATGTLDATFGSGGIARVSGTDTRGADVSVLSDDRIVLVGTENESSVLVARLTDEGTPDVSFDPDGQAAFALGTGVLGTACEVYPDGDILAAGYTYADGNRDESMAIALRVTSGPVASDGSPDATPLLRLTIAGAHPASRIGVDLSVAETTPVRIDVYDVQGRHAVTLFEGTLPTGTHTFDGPAGLAQGAYIIRAVSQDGQVVSIPAVVLR